MTTKEVTLNTIGNRGVYLLNDIAVETHIQYCKFLCHYDDHCIFVAVPTLMHVAPYITQKTYVINVAMHTGPAPAEDV